jgi:hypothetical protein
MNYKIDLHTHSILSYDGGITRNDYINVINSGTLDYIAITDHNEIDFALEMHKKFPSNIIVGEEIMTKKGEIIGLFLTGHIPKKLSLEKTIELIRAQNGLIYLPHPFDIMRYGIGEKNAKEFINDFDLIEVFNARSKLPHFDRKAKKFADIYKKTGVASTDAHIGITIGKAYNETEIEVTRANFLEVMANSRRIENYAPSIREKFAPTINVIRKFFQFKNKAKHEVKYEFKNKI